MKPLPESITTALAAFSTGGVVAKDAEMRTDDLAEIRTALAVPLCHASIARFACLCLLPTGHRGEHSGDVPPGVRALRIAMAEVDRLTAQLAVEQDKRRAADAVLAEIGGWCITHGAVLKPGGGDADTFGDGMRAAKDQIRRVLLRNLNPTAGEPRE